MGSDLELDAVLDAVDDSDFPEDFLSGYTLVECLAERRGIGTYLVRDSEGSSFTAKCFDKAIWSVSGKDDILKGLVHEGLPKSAGSFENDKMTVIVREYIEGTSLYRYFQDNSLTEEEIIRICIELCDILAYLHHREEPVIHRDIKPQNVILRPDGRVALIDFDIARVYNSENETDTIFFGTPSYAPPEQYGFSQTDARTDIYSLGILLRFLLTGSPKDNKNVQVSRPLGKIIKKCTGFSPKERFADVSQVRKALNRAQPKAQRMRKALAAAGIAAAACLAVFGGIKIYEWATYSPFAEGVAPAVISDEELTADAVRYMREKYGTDLFDNADDIATMGLVRNAIIELYGIDRDYAYGMNEDMPQESDEYFFPWGYDDSIYLDRDICVYAAVKVHDPSIVADWSSLKDDNGFYPGMRVATAFAEEHGILEGTGRPRDILVGDAALIFANADKAFENM